MKLAPDESSQDSTTLHWQNSRSAHGFLPALENILLNIAVACILVLGGIIVLSVLLRQLGFSGVDDEVVIIGELMIGALILPLAFVAAHKGFIAVEVLTTRLGPRIQIALNILGTFVGLCAVAPIGYSAYISMVHVIQTNSNFSGLLELPRWPGRIIFFVGYVAFFIRLMDLLIYDILAAFGFIQPRTIDSIEENI